MNENNKNIPIDVADNQLEDVTGGMSSWSTPDFVTSNNSRYSSGSSPKYSVGQRLKIVCRYMGTDHKVSCVVLSVSSNPNCGIFYKEFGYTVKVTQSLRDVPLEGAICEDVYESCLYEN